jgi:hypothetical protein
MSVFGFSNDVVEGIVRYRLQLRLSLIIHSLTRKEQQHYQKQQK